MLEALFAFAVVCAGLAALMGNRTAMALLASTGFTFMLTMLGTPFSAPAWIAVDLLVIAVILVPWPRIPTADCFVLALFVPSWALYFVDSEAGYAASVCVCSAQMLLTLPARRLLRRARDAARDLPHYDHFDLRVRCGDAG